jgi:hypothetical protein
VAHRIVYFTASSGKAHVREFIDSLRSVKEQAALMADIAMLAEAGPMLPFPLTSAIKSFPGLRELRSRFGSAQFRVLYTVTPGGVIVLLHAFKKTAATQTRREYNTAAQRARRI